MSATLVTAPAAGWYPDPNDSGSWRWWDGGTWTSHVRPKDQTDPVAVQPVAPHPVSAPQQVIPQPARPIQPIQPVSLTPETPASEQEYWHSAAAEIVEIPGRSATTQHGNRSAVGTGGRGNTPYNMQHEWGDVGSPQTAGIWLLAAMPLMSIALGVILGVVFGVIQGTTGASLSVPNVAFSVGSVVASWIFAGLDIKALSERGYRAPKIWWMLLLPPLAYFIVRGKAVRREGQRAWPPELLYFLSVVGILIVIVAAFGFVMTMLGGLPPTLLA